MNIPQDIKNPFSKRARAALNACARFCNNLCMGFGISLKPTNGGVSVGIDERMLNAWLSDVGAEQKDFKDTTAVVFSPTGTASINPELEEKEWRSGGMEGLEIDCYFHIQPQTSTSSYSIFQRCRLKFSRRGLLVEAKMIGEAIRIQAKNA